MNGISTQVKAYAPLPGGATAVYQPGSLYYYRYTDWLGSSRFSSTPGRAMHTDLAFAPYGEQYAVSGNVGVQGASFAGNPEDTTTNLYDAQFREYGIQGRWPSPDPAGVTAANPANPQSWNRYAYVLNNPLSFFDPSGLDCWLTGLYFPVPCPDVTSTTVNGSPFNFVGAAGDGSSRLANPIEIFMGGPKGGGGFTFSIRAPGQSFSQCMAAHTNTYSVGGALELTVDVAANINTNVTEKTSVITGNQITGLFFDGPGPTEFVKVAQYGAGSSLTVGRRTSDILSLNLAGKTGLPQALGSSGVKGLLKDAGNVLNLGVDELLKGAIDLGLAGAEAVNCAIPAGH